MGVISIRLNDKEEHILKELTRYYNEDKSSLIKRSLIDLYEDKLDFEEIEKFEKIEKKGKVKFKEFKDIDLY
ncbi:MAG: hypothetical protein GWN11_03475 [Candidatus Dadabacteria bacterium]|nr:hypothetical protein [Candidatus Dadabacteria bacterium]NIX14952.1 hypothetical protein [Candidatus Dadabacteria bacterium]